MAVRVGLYRKLSTKELMTLNCGIGEDSGESLGLQGDPTSVVKEISPEYSLEDLMLKVKLQYSGLMRTDHLKRSWCWEKLKVGEGDDRGWDGWMESPTRWTWIWASSGSWWWTGRPGMLQSMGSHRVRYDWMTDWTELSYRPPFYFSYYLLQKASSSAKKGCILF